MAVPARIVTVAALLSLLFTFVLVVAALVATGRVTGLDPVILLWLRERIGDHGPLIAVSRAVTVLGNNLTLWIVTAFAIGSVAVAQRWRQCAYLAGTTAGGAIIISAIKAAVDRPRPTLVAHLVDVHTASFPSGHAMDSAFVYGSLAVAVAADAGSRRRARLIMVVALLLVTTIGVSRLILGVLWPTDVAAGWAIGLCWTATTTQVFARRIGEGSRNPGKRTPGVSDPR